MAATEVELEDEIDEEAALRRYAGAMRDGEASAASAWGAWEGAISSMGARLQPCPTPAVDALLNRAPTAAADAAAAAAAAYGWAGTRRVGAAQSRRGRDCARAGDRHLRKLAPLASG